MWLSCFGLFVAGLASSSDYFANSGAPFGCLFLISQALLDFVPCPC